MPFIIIIIIIDKSNYPVDTKSLIVFKSQIKHYKVLKHKAGLSKFQRQIRSTTIVMYAIWVKLYETASTWMENKHTVYQFTVVL